MQAWTSEGFFPGGLTRN